MANRLSDEKANLIASHYCTNGYKRVEALLSSGYKETYAKHVGLKLFDNVTVKQAIARIEAKNSAKTSRTVQSIDDMLVVAYDLAKLNKHTSAMVAASTSIARLYGMDRQTIQVDADELKELSEQEQAMADRISKLTLIDGKVG